MAVTPKPEVLSKQPDLGDHATEDAKAQAMTMDYMREYYAKQPKVRVKLAEDTWVQVNGYTFIIKGKEAVMVPQGIADELEAVGRI